MLSDQQANKIDQIIKTHTVPSTCETDNKIDMLIKIIEKQDEAIAKLGLQVQYQYAELNKILWKIKNNSTYDA